MNTYVVMKQSYCPARRTQATPIFVCFSRKEAHRYASKKNKIAKKCIYWFHKVKNNFVQLVHS